MSSLKPTLLLRQQFSKNGEIKNISFRNKDSQPISFAPVSSQLITEASPSQQTPHIPSHNYLDSSLPQPDQDTLNSNNMIDEMNSCSEEKEIDENQIYEYSSSYQKSEQMMQRTGTAVGLPLNNHLNAAEPQSNNLFIKRQFTAINVNLKSNNLATLLSILKYYFSVGILALPQMFYLTGYLLGSFLVLGVALLTAHSIGLLVDINKDMCLNATEKQKVKQNLTLGEICYRVLGEKGRLMSRIFSIITNGGSCIAYIMFFNMYIAEIIKLEWSHKLTLEQAHLIGALIAFVIILPLSTVNDLALSWQTNFAGFFLCSLALLLMIYRDFTLIMETSSTNLKDIIWWNQENFTLAFGIVVYSFKIVGISMTIRSCMEDSSRFTGIFNLATAIACVGFLVFGIVTEFALGQYAAEIVITNFSLWTALGFVIRVSFIVSVLFSYPLKFFVIITVYENLAIFKQNVFNAEMYETGSYANIYKHQLALLKRYAFRFGLIVAIFMMTLSSVKFSKFISFVGSIGGIVNQFIIPQVNYLVYFKDSLSFHRKAVGMLMIAFYAAVTVLSSYHVVIDIIEYFRQDSNPEGKL